MDNIFKHVLNVLIICLVPLSFISCTGTKKADEVSVHIGVSQCSGGDWRSKMNDEMLREAIFHKGITFDFCNAADSQEKQLQDVDSLIKAGVDLLVLAPIDSLTGIDLVAKAKQHQIPVIVADRRVACDDYAAFIGGDNYAAGYQAAQYIHSRLIDGGEVLEIRGHDGSSPVELRHKGFIDGLSQYPELRLVESVDGMWLRDTAKVLMENAIHRWPNIKAVFAHNDYMAMGASEMFGWVRKSQHEHGDIVPEGRPLFVGVDAVYGPNHGLAWVEHGDIDASILYPTGGEAIINTAVNIVSNKPFEREQILDTYVIDHRGAALANNMDMAVMNEVERVHWLQGRELELLRRIDVEQMLLVVSVAFILFIVVSMVRMRRHYIERRRTALHLVRAYRQLRDRAKFELQEFKSRSGQINNEDTEQETQPKIEDDNVFSDINPFIEKVYQLVDENYSDADFGVEQLSVLLNMSRSQLYRKVKQLAGVTPFDIIKDKRFSEAEKLLKQGLDYEQVAHLVGYNSATYFEKCLDDYRNMQS